ncbi:MAG: SDR family NAD(P)-dependent oxidoreductase [Actinomycetota bacterium]|nr:SDR family NAD(P)-dependent oxidoreductase [Actinomycetota bacterium]
MEIENKRVLITGAASGIGRALAQSVSLRDPRAIVLVDKNKSGLEETKAALNKGGFTIELEVCDLGDVEAIAKLANDVLAKIDCVDVLFANAGISRTGDLETSEEDWADSFNINVMSQVRLARHFVPKMIEAGGGYIVNTASAAGLLTSLGALSYAVTKHGSVAFSEWLAINHAQDNIRVSVLCPMGVRTNMLFPEERSLASEENLAHRSVVESGTVKEADEVAEFVMEKIGAEEFLILPHPEVADFYSFRANATSKWIRSMAKYQQSLIS